MARGPGHWLAIEAGLCPADQGRALRDCLPPATVWGSGTQPSHALHPCLPSPPHLPSSAARLPTFLPGCSHDLGRTVDRQTRQVLHKEFIRAATLLRDEEDPLEALFAPYKAGRS